MQGYVQAFGNRLNRINERVVGGLMALLLADVWIGVLDRYLFHWQISWVEELARYIMIWAILLAVPCCSVRREHIGLDMLSRHFSARALSAPGWSRQTPDRRRMSGSADR